MTDALNALRAELLALRERVDRLEARGGSAGGLDHVLLERLGQPDPEAPPGAIQGSLLYAGSLQVNEQPLVWQRNLSAPACADVDVETAASVLSAAGHPIRIALLKALCTGPRKGAELVELLELPTTGPLYHHLDKLTRVGWVRQESRGTWGLAPEKVIPTLVLFGLVDDLRG
jgi:hypothetical protein